MKNEPIVRNLNELAKIVAKHNQVLSKTLDNLDKILDNLDEFDRRLKALEERPQGDLISRSALKEDFKSRLALCNEWIEKAKDKETKIRADATKHFICEVIMTINNAPTVDTTFKEVVAYECGQKSVERQTGEWIPISERLPKIDAENGWKASDVVLVCLANGNMHMGFYCEDKKWRFCESEEAKEPFVFDVIAWMPLPKPYEETENEC